MASVNLDSETLHPRNVEMLTDRTGFLCALISMDSGEDDDAHEKEHDSSVALISMDSGEDAHEEEQDSSVP
jgi:hypothetical protein